MGAALREFATQWAFMPWLLVLMLSLVILPAMDQWLWSGARLPMRVSAFRNDTVWFAGGARVIEIAAVVAVNGLFVPVAEEYLWRGLVQPHLARVMPAAAAIGITAVLFSLKHVVVDASWGRFVTLAAFGAICGTLAHRHSWRTSASLHVIVNTASTAAGLAFAIA